MPRDLFDDAAPSPEIAAPKDLFEGAPAAAAAAATPPQSYYESFVQKAKDVGKGLYFGALESAGNVTNTLKIPDMNITMNGRTTKFEGAPMGNYKDRYQAAAQDYAGTSNYGVPGRIAGNIAGMLPMGGATSALAAIPRMATSMAGRLGLAAAGGAAGGALQGGMMNDGSGEAGFNPMGAATGAAIGGVLGAAGNALGIVRSRLRNDEAVKSAYDNIIGKIAPKLKGVQSSEAAERIAGNEVAKIATKIKETESNMWRDAFKDVAKKPAPAAAVADLKAAAKTVMDDNDFSKFPSVNAFIQKKILGLEAPSFEDLKHLRTAFRAEKEMMWKNAQLFATSRNEAVAVGSVYDKITDSLRETARSVGKLDKFVEANEFSKEANLFSTEVGAKLRDYAVDTGAVGNFVKKFFTGDGGMMAAQKTQALRRPIAEGMESPIIGNALQQLAIKNFNADSRMFNVGAFHKQVLGTPQYAGMLKGTQTSQELAALVKFIGDNGAKGSVDLGSAANFSVSARIGSKVLQYFSSDTAGSLRRNLVGYGLLDKNQMLKQYISSKLTNKLAKAGIALQNGVLNTVDGNQNNNNQPEPPADGARDVFQ